PGGGGGGGGGDAGRSGVRRPGAPRGGARRRPPPEHRGARPGVPPGAVLAGCARRLRHQLLGTVRPPRPLRRGVDEVLPRGRRDRRRRAPRPHHARRSAPDRCGEEGVRDPPVDCALVSDADRLIALLEGKLRPLETALAESWWETSTRASPEAVARRGGIELGRGERLWGPDALGGIAAARRGGDRVEPRVARALGALR